MADEVRRLREGDEAMTRAFLLKDRGRVTLPVWVDHVGTAGTRYVNGEMVCHSSAIEPHYLECRGFTS